MRPEPPRLNRRAALAGGLALSAGLVTGRAQAGAVADGLRAIELQSGGHLGLWADRGEVGARIAWRADERFLMCSTFKTLAVAAVLARVDQGREHLDRRIAYGGADLLEYAPVTRAHVAEGGMTLSDLCRAAIELSDNTAANLILASLGGPTAVTGYVRQLGDAVTRLDRTEPALNLAPPGDPRDTTTPGAMARLYHRLVLEDALSPASRARLTGWLGACQTGAKRLAAATPKGWRIAHKTGTGTTTIGDVAVLNPPSGPPIVIAAYLRGAGVSSDAQDAAIADAGRLALGVLTFNA